MKTLMGFVSAFLTVVAPAALLADGPEPLPTKFDASTGYVTMTVSDTADASRTKYAFCHNAKKGDPQPGVGGASLKFNGGTQANVPTDNSNLVTIAEGALKVTNAAALDGAAVTFKSGTKLIIPVGTDATTDFARFGAINTKENGGFTSTATDGRIPVAFELPTGQPLTMTAAICTVKSDSALTKDSFAISRPRGYSVAFGDPVDNGNGTKTFKVTLERKGVILIFR